MTIEPTYPTYPITKAELLALNDKGACDIMDGDKVLCRIFLKADKT